MTLRPTSSVRRAHECVLHVLSCAWRAQRRLGVRLSRAAIIAAWMAVVAPLGVAQTASVSDAFFKDLGGEQGIEKIVAAFLPIVLADARIKEKFADVDMARLAHFLAEQFCDLSGGPCNYSGKDMKTIHEDMAITNAQFNALAEDLQIAMAQRGVSSRAQNKLIAKLAPMQRNIVTK